jgi:hypothetical protein
MADTIRELIIQDLVTQLESLTIANGYNTSVGKIVQRGLIPVDMTQETAAVFIQPGVESAEREYGDQVLTMPVQIDAVHSLGSNNASVLGEQVLGDLITCVIGGKSNIGRIENLVYSSGGIEDYPTKEDQLLWVQMSLEITYITVIGDPYTQP